MAQVREAIRLEPDNGAAHDSLGYLLLKAGRIEDDLLSGFLELIDAVSGNTAILNQ